MVPEPAATRASIAADLAMMACLRNGDFGAGRQAGDEMGRAPRNR